MICKFLTLYIYDTTKFKNMQEKSLKKVRKSVTKGGKTMSDPEFYTTADVRRILGIGNKTCLDLFHRSDFLCIKFGKSFNYIASIKICKSKIVICTIYQIFKFIFN